MNLLQKRVLKFFTLSKTSGYGKMAFVFQKMIWFVLSTFMVINTHLHFACAEIGVVYSMVANNLPQPVDVVALCKTEQIPRMRLRAHHPDVLDALRGSGIHVILAVDNADIEGIAADMNTGIEWVNNHVVPYANDIGIDVIAVGNDMIPGPGSRRVVIAMNNIQSGLNNFNLLGIRVSTVVSEAVLDPTPLPSSTEFTPAAQPAMQDVIYWLHGTNNPLLIIVDPYTAHISDPLKVPLGYATFKSPGYVLEDGRYQYANRFEAVVDSFYVALEKNDGDSIPLIVAQTGWPSAGNEPHTTPEIALQYNQALLIRSMTEGTPRNPDNQVDVYVFTMFEENLKPPGVEQHWGFHYANGTKVYDLQFTALGQSF